MDETSFKYLFKFKYVSMGIKLIVCAINFQNKYTVLEMGIMQGFSAIIITIIRMIQRSVNTSIIVQYFPPFKYTNNILQNVFALWFLFYL